MEERPGRLDSRARKALVLAATIAALTILSFSSVVGTYAQTEAPAVPDSPVLTAEPGENDIELRWTAVAGAHRYEVWALWDSDADWQQLDDGDLSGTTFWHADLIEGTTYLYLVRGVSEAGVAGAWSEQVEATFDGRQSSLAPPILSAVATEGVVALRWTPVSGAATYELWRWSSWDGWQRLDDGTLSATDYSHSGLPAGMTYYYGIRAVDERGETGEWGQRVSATVPGFLVVPEVPEERAALVALYEATDGANWRRSDNWLSDLSIANWYGVHTDQ